MIINKDKPALTEAKKRRRRKKLPYNSIGYTTGDIALNIDRFNQAMGTDCTTTENSSEGGAMGESFKLKESWEDFDFEAYNSDDTVTVVITDRRFDPLFNKNQKESLKLNNVRIEGQYLNGIVVTGKVGDIIQVCDECRIMNPSKIFKEALTLTEAKRYVRRYYIRPQNIFCSNKAEILKTLIELDDTNCSVYTLNNLGDDKDVSKLMNSDIIYYYDDGILYDKNRVKIMDYDLSIKKEENRKHFANVDKASDKEFKNAYKDRMTAVTELEESSNKPLPFTVEELEAALKSTNWEIFIGYNYQDSKLQTVGDGVYSNTNWYVEKNDNKYLLTSVLISDDGDEYTNKTKAYESIEELYKAIQQLEPLNDMPQLAFTEKEYFNQDFDSYNAFGEKLTEAKENFCCVCGEPIEGYGNNPEPFMDADSGQCCDGCNLKFVIPARLALMKEE